MSKVLRVAWREFQRHVLRWRFVLALFSIPAMVLLAFVAVFITFMVSFDPRPIGYVDQSGLFANPVFPALKDGRLSTDLEIRTYADEAAARKALDTEELQAYFLITPDYSETGLVTMIALDSPSETADGEMQDFLAYNLAARLPPQVARRVTAGELIEVRSIDGSRQSSGVMIFELLIPFALGLLLLMIMNFTGGYLMQALVEEKENRTLEIVLTSISPGQLMTGKILGCLAVGLTQFVFWGFLPGVIALLAFPLLPVGLRPDIHFGFVALVMLSAVPALLLFGAIMVAVGATVAERNEAQQIAGFVSMPFSIPFFFFNSVMVNPNGPLSVALSLIPVTAPISLPMRAAFTNIPLWQSVLSVSLLWLVTVFAVWLAGRAFRLGMLRMGKTVTVQELLGIKKRGRGE